MYIQGEIFLEFLKNFKLVVFFTSCYNYKNKKSKKKRPLKIGGWIVQVHNISRKASQNWKNNEIPGKMECHSTNIRFEYIFYIQSKWKKLYCHVLLNYFQLIRQNRKKNSKYILHTLTQLWYLSFYTIRLKIKIYYIEKIKKIFS